MGRALAFALIALATCPAYAVMAVPVQSIQRSKFLKELVSKKSEKIDLATVALELSKEIDPSVNVKANLKTVEAIVFDVRTLAKGSTDPRARIAAINQYVQAKGITYDFSDPTAKKASNNLLSGLLQTSKGSCVTLPLLYLIVAQRLKWPIYPVQIQNHMFLRYGVPGGGAINIEATSGGGTVPDSRYLQMFNLPVSGEISNSSFKPGTVRDMAGALLQFNAHHYFYKENRFRKGFEYIEAAMELAPTYPHLVQEKAVMFRHLWKMFLNNAKLEEAEIYHDAAERFALAASKLGFRYWDNSAYLKEMRQLETQEEARKRTRVL